MSDPVNPPESSGQPETCFSPAMVRRGAGWLRGLGSESDVVVSSRVRLARNLAGFPFLCRAPREVRQQILDIARTRLMMLAEPLPGPNGSSPVCKQMLWVDVHKAPGLDRTLMVERHLISKEHARGVAPFNPNAATASSAPSAPTPGEPRGVAISLPDEALSVMVNEEDHLRLQVLSSGLEISAAYALVSRVDQALEGQCQVAGQTRTLQYAFSPRFGFLTACPTNVGTGIRVSVMLHLPGLKLVGEMDKVRRAARDMCMAVRGYYGEGSEAAGEFFQISNQTTLGRSEEEIVRELENDIVPQIVNYERAARRLLTERRRRVLEDKVFRALGALRHARLLTPEEAIMLLSDVRLGVLTGLIKDVGEQQVNQLILLTQPAHLQRALGRDMDQGERREARADLVRQALSV